MTFEQVTVSVANVPVAIECGPALAAMLRRRYRLFLSAGEGTYRAQLNWEESMGANGVPAPEMVFQPDELCFAEMGFEGQVNWHSGMASARLTTPYPLGYIDYFLRMIYALAAFERQGVMVHAAGIVHRDAAHLFFGHSGSGKTTVSRLSTGDVVLNDDLVVLLPEQGQWRVYATPFWNPSQVQPTASSAILVGLYRLVQDRHVFLEPMHPAQALAEMVSNVPVIPADARRNTQLLERCTHLLFSVPVHRLHFLPDASFWKAIDAQAGDRG